jgi:hypothetical protein
MGVRNSALLAARICWSPLDSNKGRAVRGEGGEIGDRWCLKLRYPG